MTAFASGQSPAQVLSNIQNRLLALRQALEAVNDLQLWSSGISGTDMETATGLDSADAATFQSAIADAAALYAVYDTGQAPSTYPQVTSPYVYGSSQRQVIGPM